MGILKTSSIIGRSGSKFLLVLCLLIAALLGGIILSVRFDKPEEKLVSSQSTLRVEKNTVSIADGVSVFPPRQRDEIVVNALAGKDVGSLVSSEQLEKFTLEFFEDGRLIREQSSFSPTRLYNDEQKLVELAFQLYSRKLGEEFNREAENGLLPSLNFFTEEGNLDRAPKLNWLAGAIALGDANLVENWVEKSKNTATPVAKRRAIDWSLGYSLEPSAVIHLVEILNSTASKIDSNIALESLLLIKKRSNYFLNFQEEGFWPLMSAPEKVRVMKNLKSIDWDDISDFMRDFDEDTYEFNNYDNLLLF